MIDNPKKKADDFEAKYTFYYDGPNHANALYDITQTAAENAPEKRREKCKIGM